MRACAVDKVVELVDESSEVVFAPRLLAHRGYFGPGHTRAVRVEPGQLRSSVDPVVVQDQLLIDVGVARERHVVDALELGFAVRRVGTLGALAVPVGLGGEVASVR